MSDKAVVEKYQSSFDVLVLQANLAVSAARGLGSWVDLQKPFWIDPIAYAYAAAPAYLMSNQKVARGSSQTERRYKRTFASLANQYGSPFTDAMGDQRALHPDDFADTATIEGVARRVLEWQETVLAPTEADAKYGPSPTLEPVLLTVPFFPLQPPDRGPVGWFEVNMRLASAALELYEPERLALGLLVEDSLFDDWNAFELIFTAYLGSPIIDLWLWVSENDEVAMTLPRARALRRVVREASNAGKRVHQAFGGSYSALLLREGLTSVGHGVTYWEKKGWEPIAGGGIPTLRYFYPPLRERLPVPVVAAAFDSLVDTPDEFHAVVCNCETCRSVVQSDIATFGAFGEVDVRTRVNRHGTRIQYDAPTANALRLNKSHYLQAKQIEIDRILAANFDASEALRSAEAQHTSPVISTRHLNIWRRALTE